MADIMQTPQGPDDRGSPVQPVVAGSANQTNARTGGMVGPDVLARMRDAGMPVALPTAPGQVTAPPPQAPGNATAASAMDPIDYLRYAHNVPNNPAHAAGNAMAYLIGRSEGVLHGTTAATTAQAAGQPPARPVTPTPAAYDQPGYYPDASAGAPGSPGYENAWNKLHPDNQLAARGAYIPPPPGQTESQRLHEQYGIHPDDHALASHAAANPHMYSNGAFTNIFAGKPIDYVQRLVAMMQPPSMEDQARRAAVQASGQDAARNAQVSGTDAEQQSQRAGAAREGLLEEILRTIYGGYYTKPKK